MYLFEENDDDAERLSRRQKSPATNGYSSDTSTSSQSGRTTKSLNLTHAEVSDQIAECLKLNAENRISDRNAFHLKLIDLLDYSLVKQHPSMDNLQVASACLDASGKIYGFRVDRVHSDLIKIAGATKKRTNSEDDNENLDLKELDHKRTKRVRRKQVILSKSELQGNIEFYNPLAAMNNQRDAQTTDMLYQASLPHHVYNGASFSFYNDVLLDRIPFRDYKSMEVSIPKMNDSPMISICPSYISFRFLDWFLDELNGNVTGSAGKVNNHHFNNAEDFSEESISTHNSDVFERFFEAAEIENFEDIISNHSNGNMSLEYSYLQENNHIQFIGPNHWKAKFNKKIVEKINNRRPNQKDLTFSTLAKNKAKGVFNKKGMTSHIRTIDWIDESNELKEVVLPPDFFNRYFNKPSKFHQETIRDCDNDNSSFHSDYNPVESNGLNGSGHFSDFEEPLDCSPDRFHDRNEGFTGNNLVSPPKLIDKTFIPYSKLAKRINMREITKKMWCNIEKVNTKEFSQLYLELPSTLSKVTAESLSPALAFVSLLHLAHENNLSLKSNKDYSDIIIEH